MTTFLQIVFVFQAAVWYLICQRLDICFGKDPWLIWFLLHVGSLGSDTFLQLQKRVGHLKKKKRFNHNNSNEVTQKYLMHCFKKLQYC